MPIEWSSQNNNKTSLNLVPKSTHKYKTLCGLNLMWSKLGTMPAGTRMQARFSERSPIYICGDSLNCNEDTQTKRTKILETSLGQLEQNTKTNLGEHPD